MTKSPDSERRTGFPGSPTAAGPRNRPMNPQGSPQPSGSGRGRGDWRHGMHQDQVGCAVILIVCAPIVYFLGRVLQLW